MNRDEFIPLLTRILETHSPSGQEGEMDALALEEMKKTNAEISTDDGGNVFGFMKGTGAKPPVIVTAHKDEIGVIVKRIEDDGRLALDNIGGSYPWRYGEGPMDVLADTGIVTGFLSFGASHISEETENVHEAKTRKPLTWKMVRLDMKLSKEELREKGIRPGSRAVVSRSRKTPTIIGDYVGAYALDDKALVAIMIEAMKELSGTGEQPPRDIYFVVTSGEEIGVSGAAYAAQHFPADEMIALEVAPVAKEYRIENTPQPVLIYKDGRSVYHKETTDVLYRLAEQLGFGCQS